MWFNGTLASLGTLITYLLQVICCYLATRSICALVKNARVRVRLWGCFLFLTVAAWVVLLLRFSRANSVVHDSFRSLPPLSQGSLHVALPVTNVLASDVARFASTAADLYVLLLLISVVYLISQSGRLKAVLRRTQPPSQQLSLRFQRLRLELGIARCELDLSAEINSPATCYWWRPHVLLPAEIVSRLDDDQLDDVLRHELLHVKRKDYLWDRIAALGCRLVFFHPLAWLGYRHLRWERELACDHAVVRESAEARLRYAECLTMLARWLMERKRFSPGISLFSSESLLAVRVRSLLREPRAYSVPCAVARTGLATIVGIITLLFTPGIGLSFYSPIHLTKLLANGNVIPSHARKKAIGVRHAFALTSADPDTSLPVQDTMPEPTKILSVFPPKALPVLSSSPAIEAATETDSHVDKGDVNLSRSVWDEAPAPLATAPKWRTFAIKAITRGIGAAASRVGVDDDDDGPRRRSR